MGGGGGVYEREWTGVVVKGGERRWLIGGGWGWGGVDAMGKESVLRGE